MGSAHSMRAAVFDRPGRPLDIVARPVPEPGERQVLLKVGRCGICGSDLHLTEPESCRLASGSIIGHEISGEVVALGSGVTRIKVGDHVAALPITGCGSCPECFQGEPAWCRRGRQVLAGGYAQYALAGERECLVLPLGLSFADGALVEPLAVALHGVRMAPDLRGAKVLVLGVGPIGLAAVFWARRLGAAKVGAIDGNQSRIELAMALGASFSQSPEEAADAVAAFAPDIVFECVGRPGLLADAIEAVRPRGTVVSLGFCMVPEQIMASAAAVREVTLIFPVLYSIEDFQLTIDALEAGHVEARTMITDTITLDQLPAIFEELRRPSGRCKVMIDPWAGE